MNRKELVEKLELVYSAINKSSFVPEFRNFHFNKETLAATDGVVSIYTTSPLPESSFSVKAEAFLNLLRGIEADDIELIFKGDSLKVRTTRVEGKFKIESARNFVLVKPESPIPIEQSLIDGIKYCRYGVNKEKTSGAASGVRIESRVVYSTDRFRIHRYELAEKTTIEPCTIPVKFAEILLRHQEFIKEYGLKENKFYIVLEDNTLIETSIFADKYKELEQYFEILKDSKPIELKFNSNLKDIIEIHLKSFLSDVDAFDRELIFSISENICILGSESKDKGKLIEHVELKSSIDQEITFVVNPNLLYEVLQYGKGSFLYHPDFELVHLDAGALQVLIQTKV